MYRRIIFIIILAMSLLVQGCVNGDSLSLSPAQTTESTSVAPADTTVTSSGIYGDLSVTLPHSWESTICLEGSDKMMYGLYGIILKPKDAPAGQIEVFCSETFGVCGTGLTQKEMTLAGYNAHVGTYFESKNWDFIVFTNIKPRIVAQHTDCSSWTDEMWTEALRILDTIKFTL